MAVLQGNLINNVSAGNGVLNSIPAKDPAVDTANTGLDVQNFAALFGKTAPTAKKADPGINLDDTLNALSDVLADICKV